MTTLATIKTRARQLADMENSAFIGDSELTYMVNASYQELYDLVLQSYEDYFVTSTTFTISSGNTYSLPATFYKLKGVDLLQGADYVSLVPFNFADRNRIGRFDLRYRLLGDTLTLEPSDNATGSYKLWYIPSVTELASSSDAVNTNLSRMGWDEYIAIDCAIKMREKEESNTAGLERMKLRMADRITNSATGRDAGAPATVTNVRTFSDDERDFFPWVL